MRIVSSAVVFSVVMGLTACSSKFADSTTDENTSEGTNPGDCTDGADNDGDSLFDCDDSGCAGSPFCKEAGGGSSSGGDDSSGESTGGGTGSGGGSGSGSGGGTGSGSASGGGSSSGAGGTDGGGTGPVDVDGDGVPAIDDCDDTDPSVYPDAPERCDGKDNDCNDEIDDNPVDGATYYPDNDSDGYGDADLPVELCAPRTGYTTIGEDCDDRDEMVFPGVAESCDGVDQDCNGEIDEGLETTMYYADSDGDGFGDPDVREEACRPPDDYVENPDDCDDSLWRVNPEGTEISWSDIDEDCDGYDLDFLECAEDTLDDSVDYLEAFYYTVSDLDGYVYDPLIGIFPVGEYRLMDGFLVIEGSDMSATPTEDPDVFALSITIDFYMTSNLWADYEGFDPTTCELESGPLPVNYSGTMEITPRASHATSRVNLETTIEADPSSVTAFEGCDLDLIDIFLSFADFDYSVTTMVDESLVEVANAFEEILEEDLEIQTRLTCRP